MSQESTVKAANDEAPYFRNKMMQRALQISAVRRMTKITVHLVLGKMLEI